MAKIFARLVYKGRYTLETVPASIRVATIYAYYEIYGFYPKGYEAYLTEDETTE